MRRKPHLVFFAAVMVFILIGPVFCGDIAGQGKDGNWTDSKKPMKKPDDGYNRYFGDLHTHTAYSDAWEGTPWDAYKAAIDAGADYMAITDHWSAWNAYKGLAIDAEEWADTLAAVDYFTSESFVAIAGLEIWLLGHLGEINVYNIRELPPEEQLKNKHDRLPDFYDWLVSEGAIGQWNHPTYMTDNFEDFAYYSEARDAAMNVIEVYNGVVTEDSYIMALDAGWHVMPSANSDTHDPNWIAGYEERTVLLAKSLTHEDLYDAMRSCRGYATLDKNLYVHYTLNGAVMGSILSPSRSSSYTWEIYIEDPDGVPSDAITLVEIVSNGGKVVASKAGSGTTFYWKDTLRSEDAQYFYVRVTTASPLGGGEGVTAWTAPVWTGK